MKVVFDRVVVILEDISGPREDSVRGVGNTIYFLEIVHLRACAKR